MALELSNLLSDTEQLYRVICYYKKKIHQLYERRRNIMNSDPQSWTVSDENDYKLQMIDYFSRLSYYQAQLKAFIKATNADSQTALKLLPYLNKDNKRIRDKIDTQLEAVGQQLKDPQTTDATVILEKKVVPHVTYDLLTNRRPMGKDSGLDQFEIVQLTVPPQPIRIQCVYRDQPDEPIANGTVLFWLYDDGKGYESQFEGYTIRLTKYTSHMVCAGICRTGPDGFLLPGAPFYDQPFQFGADAANSLFAVGYKPDVSITPALPDDTIDVKRFFSMPIESIYSRATAHTWHLKINDINRLFSGNMIETLLDPKATVVISNQGQFMPFEQIMTTHAAAGYQRDQIDTLGQQPAFNILAPQHPQEKTPVLSPHFFQTDRQYGFMAYPADYAPYASLDANQLAAISTSGNTPANTLAPDNPGGVIWKGTLKPTQIINSMYQATIALHCTLPEWDRRLNRQLKKFTGACHSYRQCLSGHMENQHRVQTIKKAAELYQNFHYDDIDEEACQKLINALEDFETGIQEQIETPKDHSRYCGIANAEQHMQQQAQTLWQMLQSPALHEELERYTTHIQSTSSQDQKTGTPGPYMQTELFWNHIFFTLGKCYAALMDTDLGEEVYRKHVRGFLFSLAQNALEMDLAVDSDTDRSINEVQKYFEEPDQDDPKHNRLNALNGRITAIRRSTVIPQTEEPSVLSVISDAFQKTNKLYLRSPGPPNVVQVLLDTYYERFFKDVLKLSKRNTSLHLLISFGFARVTGLIQSDGDLILFKGFFFRYIRAHGRVRQPEMRNHSELKYLLKIAKQQADEFIASKFPNRPTKTDGGFSDQVYDKITARTGSVAHAFKSFCLCLNLAYTIEAVGNMVHTDFNNPQKVILYTAKVLEQVGAMTVGSFSLVRTASRFIISLDPPGMGQLAKKGAQKIDKMLLKSAGAIDVLAIGLSYLACAIATIEAVNSFKAGKTGDFALNVTRAVGEGAFALGTTMRTTLVKKGAQWLGKKLAARGLIAGGGGVAAAVFGSGGTVLVVGAVIVICLTLYDVASLIRELLRTPLDKAIQNIWQGIEESHFINPQGDTIYYHESYFSEDFGGPDLRQAYKEVDSLRETGILDWRGVGWNELNWRAAVPMYKMGFKREIIAKCIHMDAEIPEYDEMMKTRFKKVQSINRDFSNTMITIYGPNWKKTANRQDIQKHAAPFKNRIQAVNTIAPPPMSVTAIIDYYKIVSEPQNADKTFASGKTYADVADELSHGVFTPDKKAPENLPGQSHCKSVFPHADKIHGQYPQYSKELISHNWNHDIFQKR